MNLWSQIGTIPPIFVRLFTPLLCCLLVAILACGGSYLVCLRPAQDRLEQALTAYQEARNHMTSIETARQAQQAARIKIKRIETLRTSLPAQHEFATLAMKIADWGRAEYLSIPSMTYTLDRAEGQKPIKGAITFVATGEYQAIYRFIHKLESTESYLVIEQLRAARSERGSNGKVAFSIQVATFLRPEPARGVHS